MQAILFDIDGTLIRSGGAGRAALEAALEEVFGISNGTTGVTLSGKTDTGIHAEIFVLHDLPATDENRRLFLEAYLRHLPKQMTHRKGHVLPGVLPLLETLGQSNSIIGLLTGNVREGARLKLDHFGMHHHFAFGGFGDLHSDRDDVARSAIAALREHHNGELPPDKIWVIGDTPADVRCARAVGARAVAVATGEYTTQQLEASKPDCLLRDMSDVKSLLRVFGLLDFAS